MTTGKWLHIDRDTTLAVQISTIIIALSWSIPALIAVFVLRLFYELYKKLLTE